MLCGSVGYKFVSAEPANHLHAVPLYKYIYPGKLKPRLFFDLSLASLNRCYFFSGNLFFGGGLIIIIFNPGLIIVFLAIIPVFMTELNNC